MNEHAAKESQIFFDPSGFKPVSVGLRLRELRKEKGLKIKELAAKSGLAINTLSLIENEKTSPSVNTLEQLAKTLEIPMALFFEPIIEKQFLINTQAGHRREMWIGDIRVEDCGLELHNQPIQPLIVTLPAGQSSGPDLIQHAGHEFIYCLSGTIEYTVKDETYTIKSGDSLFFDSQQLHQWKNAHSSPAIYMLIMVPGDRKEISGEAHFSAQA